MLVASIVLVYGVEDGFLLVAQACRFQRFADAAVRANAGLVVLARKRWMSDVGFSAAGANRQLPEAVDAGHATQRASVLPCDVDGSVPII